MRKEKPSFALRLLPVFVFALLAFGYLVWFIPQAPQRISLLAEVTDPFAFVAQWFGPAGTPLGFFDRVPVIALAGLILLAAYGIGSLVVAQCGPAVPAGLPAPDDVDRWGMSNQEDWPQFSPLERIAALLATGLNLQDTLLERIVFSLAVGLNLLATLVLLVGLAGLLPQTWLMWLLVILPAGFGGWQFVREHWSQRSAWRDHWSRLREHAALSWLAITFATVVLLGSLLPPWDFDVREYHLQVPKEWLQQGQITFLPHNVYGNMPLAAEMPALFAMSLGPGEHGWFYGALAGKVVIAAFSIVTALALYVAGSRWVGAWCGILAAAIYLSLPWVMHVSANGLNDGVLAGYVFLAAYAMWLARRGACSFLLPGLLAGGAAACKYPGVAIAVVPLMVWAAIPRGAFSRREEPSSARALPSPGMAVALVSAGMLIGGGAWYAKNAALAGNPVYPLAFRVFGGNTRTAEKAAQWDKAHQVPRDEAGWRYSPRQLAGSLVQIAGRDPLASPLLVPLTLAAMAGMFIPNSAIRTSQLGWICVPLLLWTFAVWWLVTHRIERFLLPALPFAAFLAASGAAALCRAGARWAMYGFLLVGLAYGFLANSSTLVFDNRWFVSLEQLRRDQPWPQHTPQRVKLSHRWLNENVQPGQAVLLVGDAEPFELAMPVFYNTCFDDCLLCDWTLNKTPSERHQELARRSVAWVVVDWPEIARYQQPGNYGFDSRFKPELLDELVQQGVLDPPVKLGEGYETRPTEVYPVRGVSPKPDSPSGVE